MLLCAEGGATGSTKVTLVSAMEEIPENWVVLIMHPYIWRSWMLLHAQDGATGNTSVTLVSAGEEIPENWVVVMMYQHSGLQRMADSTEVWVDLFRVQFISTGLIYLMCRKQHSWFDYEPINHPSRTSYSLTDNLLARVQIVVIWAVSWNRSVIDMEWQ